MYWIVHKHFGFGGVEVLEDGKKNKGVFYLQL